MQTSLRCARNSKDATTGAVINFCLQFSFTSWYLSTRLTCRLAIELTQSLTECLVCGMLCSPPRSTRRPWARRCVVPLLDVALHVVIKNTDVPGGLGVLFAGFKWQESYFGWSYERRECNLVLDTKWYGGNCTVKIDACETLKFQMSALVWAFSIIILFMPKTLYVFNA